MLITSQFVTICTETFLIEVSALLLFTTPTETKLHVIANEALLRSADRTDESCQTLHLIYLLNGTITLEFPNLASKLLHHYIYVTSSTALRLLKFFGNSSEFWLNLQLSWDLYHVLKQEAEDINKILRCKGIEDGGSTSVNNIEV